MKNGPPQQGAHPPPKLASLLADLSRAGVELAPHPTDPGLVRYRCPRGALTEALAERVRAAKPALLAWLRASAAARPSLPCARPPAPESGPGRPAAVAKPAWGTPYVAGPDLGEAPVTAAVTGCRACGRDWWWRPRAWVAPGWTCAACHPPAPGLAVERTTRGHGGVPAGPLRGRNDGGTLGPWRN